MKSFIRFLKRNPFYTIINIAGLSVALMFVILIGDYTWRQFSVDSSQPDKDRIVLMGNNSDFFSWPDVSHEIGRIYPEIEKTCCVVSHGGAIRSEKESFKDSERDIMLLADSTFFDIFSYDFVYGDPDGALSSPEKCVITESLAESLYPGKNAIGEVLRIIGDRAVFINDGSPDPYDSTLVYTVSGVIRDFDKTVLPNATKIIASISRHPQMAPGFQLPDSSERLDLHCHLRGLPDYRDAVSPAADHPCSPPQSFGGYQDGIAIQSSRLTGTGLQNEMTRQIIIN